MRALHVFAGAGGSVLAGILLGWESVGCVELDPFCCAVLAAHGEEVVGNDIRDFNAAPFAGGVHVVVGGSPCQDFSLAGAVHGRRGGGGGARGSLWREQLRVTQECRAPLLWWENVPGVLSSNKGQDFRDLLGALDAAGYDAQWCCNRASDVGAPHRRERLWLLANARSQRLQIRHWLEAPPGAHAATAAHPGGPHQPRVAGGLDGLAPGMDWPAGRDEHPHPWEPPKTVPGGMTQRVARVRALGGGWVPAQAVAAWHELVGMLAL